MAENDILSAVSSDLKTAFAPGTESYYSIPSETTDGVANDGLTRYNNSKWSAQLGAYKNIPELRAVIDARKKWTIGKGSEGVGDSKEMTEINLMMIRGIGNESFNEIIGNMSRTADIGGDSFAEQVRDDLGGLINLKPLDPSTVVIVAEKTGIIKHYEIIDKNGKTIGDPIPPERMLHFTRNRVADEIHGISLVDSLVEIILMRNEAMADYRQVMHWHVAPRWKFKLKTDIPAEIADYKATQDKATGERNNIYEPMDVSESELISIPPNSTLSPIVWIDNLNEYFYEVAGVPKIIIGSSRAFTEASAKIAYLAFQQTIEEKQLYIEEQVLYQLGLEIELEFPASLENELLSDNKKDVEEGAAQANDTKAGAGE